MNGLDVAVRLNAAEGRLEIIAQNRGSKQVTLVGCAVLLPIGLRVSPEPARTDYPLDLGSGSSHAELFGCGELARHIAATGERGKVRLVGLMLEAGGFDESRAPRLASSLRTAGGVEHRSEPFVFDTARWAQ